MTNLKNSVMNYLTNSHGFTLESYEDSSNGLVNLIAIKVQNEGDYAVLITTDMDDNKDTENALRYLNSRGRRYGFHKIIISRRGYINNDNYSKVVVDEATNNIIYYDQSADVLARVIRNINNNRDRNKYKDNYNNSNSNKPNSNSIKFGNGIFNKSSIITLTIIGINLFMYLISVIKSHNLISIDSQTLIDLGGQFGIGIKAGQYWRLITSMFLHAGIAHLAFNMYALFYFGPQVERVFGKVKFLIIYFSSGLGAAICSYTFSSLFSLSVGASGAIFGLFGALLIFTFLRRDRHNNKDILGYLIFIIIVNLILGFSMANIDNYAHIGGLIIGAIIAFVFIKIDDKKYA